MAQINQPSNRIQLTNVAIVRLKKAGKRFEVRRIARYNQSLTLWIDRRVSKQGQRMAKWHRDRFIRGADQAAPN